MNFNRWSIHKIRLIASFAVKDEETQDSQAKTRPETDCGSDYELLIPKFRLKENRETTRPFRYNLNQILYTYTVEMMNRFQEIRSGRQDA